MIFKADFHIHSCLSPCGDLSMSPKMIVKHLKNHGINLAALTDHNSALNCQPFMELCTENAIAALSGIEVQTTEEVHILCLFNDWKVALELGEEIYEMMPNIMNIPEKMGDQVYVDKEENILGEVDKFLVTSAEISIDDLADKVHKMGGLVIPAHVDRPAFSLTSQLGFIPQGDFDALETLTLDLSKLPKFCNTTSYAIIHSSDAHYVEQIGQRFTQLNIDGTKILKNDGRVDINVLKEALESLI
ncbi:MAG: PHP domain-containing protein [Treponema sp.]|nr:PHP domain-containing protein [Treponema sp.]